MVNCMSTLYNSSHRTKKSPIHFLPIFDIKRASIVVKMFTFSLIPGAENLYHRKKALIETFPTSVYLKFLKLLQFDLNITIKNPKF